MRSSHCRQHCDEWEAKAIKWGACITNNTTLEQKQHVISLICIIIRNLFTRKFKKIPRTKFIYLFIFFFSFFEKKITKIKWNYVKNS